MHLLEGKLIFCQIRRGADWWSGAKDIVLSSCGWAMVSSTDPEEVSALFKSDDPHTIKVKSCLGEHLLGLHTWWKRYCRKGPLLTRRGPNAWEKSPRHNIIQERFLSEKLVERLLKKTHCLNFVLILISVTDQYL